MAENLLVRARVLLAVTAQQTADLCRGIVGDVSTPMPTGERIRKARAVRLQGLSIVDLAVMAELTDGATWEQVARALSVDADDARRRYEPVWEQWQDGDYDGPELGEFTIGTRSDLDLLGTAEALDLWHARHTEPWEDYSKQPVSRVLVDRQ